MFKGLGNLGNLASMVGKLKELPQHMHSLNAQMKSERVSAQSTCGQVSVTINGVGEVQSVEISQAAFGDGQSAAVSAESLGQAIQEATNAAGREAKQMYADAISRLAADLNIDIPGMDGLLASLTGGNG